MAHWRRGWPIDRVEVADDLIVCGTTDPKSGRTRYCWRRVRNKSNVLFHGPDHKCF